MSAVRCDRCKNKIVQKSNAGTRVFVQGPLVIGDDGRCVGRCASCHEPVAVPLALQKSFEEVPRERYVIVERGLVKRDDT